MSIKIASILATTLALLSSSTHASANHELRNELTWLSERSFSMTDPDDPRHVEIQVNSQTFNRRQSSITLPNGADSLKESYGDWAVECNIVETWKKCSIGQFQYDQQQHAIMFSIEILPPENGDYRGSVRMPFGLKLSDGIRLKLDKQAVEQRGSFATCLLNGCLVPLIFSGSSIEAMKTGKTVVVSATAFSGGQSPTFNVSLKGFAAAIERLRELQ